MNESDGFSLNGHGVEETHSIAQDLPLDKLKRIGRYRIERMLGRGSFGLVYLAFDEQLTRKVALKVPHTQLVKRVEDAESYLLEAQTVAKLDHPTIVPVHDVGSSDECPFYIVSKYIEGASLANLKEYYVGRYKEIAEIVASIADALHYAHTRGVVHRDIKPGNILIDTNSNPFVVDFGLALKEEDIGKGPRYVGTPAYMSPEQAQGEGHRVDGRSDIYSLGAMLYELLVGRRTFSEQSKSALLLQIATNDPKPPRQLKDGIPKELERICLKAISRRTTDRYTTARDMADELRQFTTEMKSPSLISTGTGSESHARTLLKSSTSNPDSYCDSYLLRIVPKGLRSFDEHDADFFLELLPGAKDRNGYPESIRFWKTRIEEREADKTFSVGLIYGPTGCGKSSLVKAGLIPNLNDDIETIYIEASADQTESRLLKRLHTQCTRLPKTGTLKDAFANLRKGGFAEHGRKVLVVIDQFEQWLHSKNPDSNEALVQALRQCDGGNIQCILMVRDDFWMAATRLVREIEVQLLENHNLAAVDLFPERHALDVLAAFGRAFGTLPEQPSHTTQAQNDFLTSAISDLSENGKVICVRLALFAEMMKGKEWVPSTLEGLGGTQGVGVRFLDETFQAKTASPEHRFHFNAARSVLQALLPATTSNIKGEMKSYDSLLRLSGYTNRKTDFDALIRILDSEIRLITPTNTMQDEASDNTGISENRNEKYFQLTHDYLVPSLRDWLTRNQRETHSGRVELNLAELASTWNVRKEFRQLPSLWEYLNIVIFTTQNAWTPIQAKMMKVAGRFHGLRLAIVFSVMTLIGVGIGFADQYFEQLNSQNRANSLIDQLMVAELQEVPTIDSQLQHGDAFALERLRRIANSSSFSDTERLRAKYSLVVHDIDVLDELISDSLQTDHKTLGMIRERLSSISKVVVPKIWKIAKDPSIPSNIAVRAAAILAPLDSDNQDWDRFSATTVEGLLAEESLYIDEWNELLRPVAKYFIPIWKAKFADSSSMNSDHVIAARVLARIADGDLMSELILQASPDQCGLLFPGIARDEEKVVAKLTSSLRIAASSKWDTTSINPNRNAIATLLKLNKLEEIEPHITNSADPTNRTHFILQLRDFNIPATTLLQAYHHSSDPCSRQALLLALDRYRGRDLTEEQEKSFVSLLKELLVNNQSPAERSAAEWLLKRRGHSQSVLDINKELSSAASAKRDAISKQRTWVNSEGHVMLSFPATDSFQMGSDPSEPGHENSEQLMEVPIQHAFAVSAHEVTLEQFKRFRESAEFARDVARTENCPANKINVVDAMKYCRWLSEQEEIPIDQMCYPSIEDIGTKDINVSDDKLALEGYRLLLEKEWEYVCRSKSRTAWFFGNDENVIGKFVWFGTNSESQVHSVGLLMPNSWGLFDILGNVGEWCQPTRKTDGFLLKGGTFQFPIGHLRSAKRYVQSENGYSFTGFRIAKTLRPNSR